LVTSKSDAGPLASADAGPEASAADSGSDDRSDLEHQLEDLARRQRDLEVELGQHGPHPADHELLEHLARPLLAAACVRAERCCSRDELALLFGSAVTSPEECEALLVDLAPRGASQDLTGALATVFQLVSEAVALQAAPGFEVDAAAVGQCAHRLTDLACDSADDGRCHAPELDDPCSPSRLLRGVALSGEACDASSSLPQCDAGLICRALPELGGRCVAASIEGDRCIDNRDCTSDALFCNVDAGRCERRREQGEACAYGDDSVDPEPEVNGRDMAGLRIACARGLACNVSDKVCVPQCGVGSPCSGTRDNRDCGPGLVCPFGNRCSLPLRDGAECDRSSECEEGTRCFFTNISNSSRCFRSLSIGVHCDRLTQNCDGDSVCAYDSAVNQSRCKVKCKSDGDCVAAEFCVMVCDGVTGVCASEQVGCNPKLADGDSCQVEPSPPDALADRECSSGFCDRSSNLCTPKVASLAACDSGRSSQCPDGHYCQSSQCVPLLAAGANCAGLADDACGPNAFCRVQAGIHTCTATPQENDACDPNTGLVCPAGTGLHCIDFHTGLVCPSATGVKCVLGHCLSEHTRPPGASCSADADCASGYCDGETAECQQRVAEGATCLRDGRHDNCEANLYCNGKCIPRGSAGMPCKPSYYAGRDCFAQGNPLEAGHCVLHGPEARCAADALAPGTAVCDGK
jgi:hypothetical protein